MKNTYLKTDNYKRIISMINKYFIFLILFLVIFAKYKSTDTFKATYPNGEPIIMTYSNSCLTGEDKNIYEEGL
jgi:hypothetical protein